MIRCMAVYLCDIFKGLNSMVEFLLQIPDQNVELHTDSTKGYARLHALLLLEAHKHIFLDDDLSMRVWRLTTELGNGTRFTPAVLARDLQGIMFQAYNAISKRNFAYIPPGNDQYFEQEKLFGDKVYDKIEAARIDIKAAGNCFAAELYTACIFHLMRVSEFGLRELAQSLNVTITHTGSMIPLEYGEWDTIITNINNKIVAARQLPRDAPREEQLQKHSEQSQHCLFIKDIWRNAVSHARKPYTVDEALAAMGRVKDFMQFLAGSL
jgi:hypothetical protein